MYVFTQQWSEKMRKTSHSKNFVGTRLLRILSPACCFWPAGPLAWHKNRHKIGTPLADMMGPRIQKSTKSWENVCWIPDWQKMWKHPENKNGSQKRVTLLLYTAAAEVRSYREDSGTQDSGTKRSNWSSSRDKTRKRSVTATYSRIVPVYRAQAGWLAGRGYENLESSTYHGTGRCSILERTHHRVGTIKMSRLEIGMRCVLWATASLFN